MPARLLRHDSWTAHCSCGGHGRNFSGTRDAGERPSENSEAFSDRCAGRFLLQLAVVAGASSLGAIESAGGTRRVGAGGVEPPSSSVSEKNQSRGSDWHPAFPHVNRRHGVSGTDRSYPLLSAGPYPRRKRRPFTITGRPWHPEVERHRREETDPALRLNDVVKAQLHEPCWPLMTTCVRCQGHADGTGPSRDRS
jgi:hypothetical protein